MFGAALQNVSFAKMLGPLVKRLNGAGDAPTAAPSREDDGTRFGEFPWDLRTVIAVFPPEAPFRFLNLNLLLGMTGIPFDRVETWEGGDPLDACDLQFCLEGRAGAVTHKGFYSVAEDVSYEEGAVQLGLGERLSFSGAWPRFEVRYAQPEADLELTLQLDSQPGIHWWAHIPRAYFHYTSFVTCRMTWRWGAEQGTLEVPALHDHGWGRNMLPARLPLRVFRYEVFSLPAGGQASTLWTEVPGGVQLVNTGHVRPEPGVPGQAMHDYACEVLEWETFANYAGEPRRVPRRWRGELHGPGGSFSYEAERKTAPRPVIGDGFMCAFDYEAHGSAVPGGRASGEGYVEQFGLL